MIMAAVAALGRAYYSLLQTVLCDPSPVQSCFAMPKPGTSGSSRSLDQGRTPPLAGLPFLG